MAAVRPWDPRKLDIAALCSAGGELSGDVSLRALGRLAGSVLDSEPAGSPVHWQAQGELHPVTGGEPEIWLRLTAQVCINMRCQRCLGTVAVPLDLDRSIRFVRDASEAEALDAELEDDVLELERHMDLLQLLEDELLLALPLVPRHDVCPQPLPLAFPESGQDESARENPFAALSRLKKSADGQ